MKITNKYVVLFPSGGSVKIDLSDYKKEFSGKWVSIKIGEWGGGQFSLKGGSLKEIVSPGTDGWFALITSK